MLGCPVDAPGRVRYASRMDDLMNRLEAWRKGRDLSKVEMSKVMGCNTPQHYGNWVARDSLPKEYFPKALGILGDNFTGDFTKARETDVEALAQAVLDATSLEQAHRIARLVLRK